LTIRHFATDQQARGMPGVGGTSASLVNAQVVRRSDGVKHLPPIGVRHQRRSLISEYVASTTASESLHSLTVNAHCESCGVQLSRTCFITERRKAWTSFRRDSCS